MSKAISANVFSLFDNHEADLPEVPLDVEPAVRPMLPPEDGSAVDLTGRPKVVMVMAPGRAGKSFLCRWIVERALERDSSAVVATTDTLRPTLKQFYPGSMLLPGPNMLEKMLSKLLELKRSAVIDFAADQSLAPLLAQMPDLQGVMCEAGVEPVVVYMLTPREADLTVLNGMEEAGFQPMATALMLNYGTMRGSDADAEFGRIRRHSAYRAAIKRGAVELWLPRLWASEAVEARLVGFRQAMNHAAGGSDKPPLGMMERSRLSNWLAAMELCMKPIASWVDL